MKIFISSPRKGLKEERDYLISKKVDMGTDISAMEFFMASPQTPKEVCIKELRDSDLVILLLGPYYGNVDSETGMSFTEIEYNEASDLGIPVFVFVKVKDKDSEWIPEDENEGIRNKHILFKQKISKERCYQKFTSLDELLSFIKPSIDKYKAESRRKYAPFVDYQEYFNAFIGKDKLFRHDYPLEGRDKELQDIFNFIASDKKALIIYGRGGIGKSKILFETAKRIVQGKNKDWKRVLFIRENVIFNGQILSGIPSGQSILILEDAHRYGYLRNVLSIFSNSDLRDRIKLIISTRTSGKEYLDMTLSTSPLDINEIDWLSEIKELDIDETKRIVTNIIGKDKRLIDYLAQMTKDCPLAAIIGTRLVKDKQVNPQQINNSEIFQRTVLNRFLEEIMKVKLENAISIKLLNYISALAPVRPADEKFIEKLSTILTISYSDLKKNFDFLEEKGLLLRRGRFVRIVPDLLSDHILHNACVSKDGTSTNLADEVFEQFHETHTSNILANISEVEWRSSVSSKSINLLNNIWAGITKKFINSHNYQRVQILGEIEKAAFFQPKHVLNIVKIAISKPSSVKPQGEYAELMRDWDHKYVLEKVPSLLKNIAYHLDYVKEVCNILWELGRDDKRELNPYPEHPIRILQDLASYHIKKPVVYHQKIIEFIEEIISQPGVHSYKYSPLDVIDELFAKEGEFTESKGAVFTMSAFRLNVSNIMPIRRRALAVLRKCFSLSFPPNVIARSFNSLTKALSYPSGSFGRVISDEEEREWLPEQLEILDIIRTGAEAISSQAINVLIKKELRWFQMHGRHDELKNRVSETINSIEENYDFKLFRAVMGNFIEFYDTGKSFEEREKEVSIEMQELAKVIKEKENDVQKIFDKLNFVIDELDQFQVTINPNHLFSEITKQFPEIALRIYELGINNPNKPIMRFSSSFIWPISREEKHRKKLHSLIKQGLNTKNFNICINIAHAYAWGGLIENFQQDDIDNLKSLIDLENNEILNTTLHAISKLGKMGSKKGFELVLRIKLNEKIVDQLFGAFDGSYGISPESLEKEEIETLLSNLIPVDIFRGQHYHVDKFLEFVSRKYPGLAISFLLERLQYSKTGKKVKEYTPLPYLGFRYAFAGISKEKDYENYVRKVRDLSLNVKNLDTFWLPKLFVAVSDNYSDRALNVLSEWINSKDSVKIDGISLLLRDAPDSFLFNKYEFVGDLILQAKNISEECLKNVQSNLFGIAISGTRSRSVAVASEKSIALRDRGKEIANKFDVSHPANKFYMDVSEYGMREIKEELERDEELLDE